MSNTVIRSSNKWKKDYWMQEGMKTSKLTIQNQEDRKKTIKGSKGH